MALARTFSLFLLTAIAEIVGCYLPYLWLRNRGSVWLLIPAAGALAALCLFAQSPSDGGRPSLCRLWRCLRRSRSGVATNREWRDSPTH